MSFSPAQDHSLPQSIPATPLSSGPPELTVDGEHTPFQLEQTANFSHIKSKAGKVPTIKQGIAAIQFGPENLLSPLGRHAREHSSINSEHERDKTSNPNSLPSGHSSRLGFRKRLSGLFHRKPKLRDVAVAAPAATLAPNGHVLRVHAALPEAKVTPVDLDPCPSTQSDSADSPAMATDQVETLHVSNSAVGEWLQPNPSALGSLRLDIFPENVAAPVLVTELPKPHTRIEKTSQLVYCCSLLSKGQSSSSPNAGSDGSQSTPLDESQREWVQASESFEKNHVRWLIDQLVKSFAEDQLKGSTADAEIVLVGPILGRETYRSLLSCFISKFEQTTPLDLNILQGLVQLVEDASSGYLVDNDLVRIATVLYKELETTHNGTSDHPLFLTWALSRVLDVMVAGKVKDLDRDRDHQPMLQLLDDLKGSDNAYLHYQAAYAYQALQYAPDDETPLQVVWRYAQVAAAAASTVSSVFKLDPAGFLEGIESLQKIGEGVIE
ncbi:hypothetical protein BGX29_000557 [Mortierella sp. GBA35]|nr:hypothetical protein BGX29_000557 [Mortierella sp. GBA35]